MECITLSIVPVHVLRATYYMCKSSLSYTTFNYASNRSCAATAAAAAARTTLLR